MHVKYENVPRLVESLRWNKFLITILPVYYFLHMGPIYAFVRISLARVKVIFYHPKSKTIQASREPFQPDQAWHTPSRSSCRRVTNPIKCTVYEKTATKSRSLTILCLCWLLHFVRPFFKTSTGILPELYSTDRMHCDSVRPQLQCPLYQSQAANLLVSIIR